MTEEKYAHSVDVVRNYRDYGALSRILWSSQNIQGYRITAWMLAAVIAGTAHEWLSDLPWVQKHIFYDYGAFYMAGMVGIFFILAGLVYRILARNIRYVAPDQNFMRPRRIVMSGEGLQEMTSVSNYFVSWKGITAIARTQEYFLFYVDAMQAHIIPVRNFPSKDAADAFYKDARALWATATGGETRAA